VKGRILRLDEAGRVQVVLAGVDEVSQAVKAAGAALRVAGVAVRLEDGRVGGARGGVLAGVERLF